MHLRESIHIEVSPTTVWPFVADPALQRLWNPKIVSVHRDHSGPVLPRERFEMVYSLGGQQRQSQVEVATCEPPYRLVFEHRISWQGQEQTSRISYQISEVTGGVEVIQVTHLSQVPCAWPLRVLMWVIFRFGKSMEEPYLERLKRVVEQQNGPVRQR